MAYSVVLNNNTTQINIADNSVDNTTSLTLFGRNYAGYGQIVAQNFVYLLENWASTNSPANPVIGQLWYNTNTQQMNICTGLSPITWSAQTTGVSQVAGLSGNITVDQLGNQGLAKLASPAFSGTPTAPLPTGTPNNQLATVQYVLNQVSSLTSMIIAGRRIKLTGPLTMYVGGAGASDSNDGLTVGSPLATMQAAANKIAFGYDLQGIQPTVIVHDGVYSAGVQMLGEYLNGSIHFIGNVSNPAACKIQGTGYIFSVNQNVNLVLSGFAIESIGSNSGTPFSVPSIAMTTSLGGVITFDHIAFGPCSYAHMIAENGGLIQVPAPNTPYSIYGGATVSHMTAAAGSEIALPQAVCSITANVSFAIFAQSGTSGEIWVPGMTINTGSFNVTAQKYSATISGYISTGGQGINFFPGNVAGFASTESHYD